MRLIKGGLHVALPIRTTVEDVTAVCGYLATKPTGATMSEARSVLDHKTVDPRKMAALKFWGLVEDNDGRLKLTEAGRRLAKDKGLKRAEVLREIVSSIAPYRTALERAV